MIVQSPKCSSLRDFQILQELGKGSFSIVYKVRRIADAQEYALKKVKIESLKQKEKLNALNEVRLLASINDKYIVAYKEAFLDDDSHCLCIVMELLPGGDVQRKINSALKGGPPFTEAEIWKALIQMTRGLKTLHDQKIVHRDLKSANVFLANDGTFKLGDLNVSKVAKEGLVTTQTGTPYYASPEVWRDEPYDMKSDIWSLGCVLYEMACLKTPFRATEMEQLFKKVQRGNYDQIPARYTKDLGQIINLLLQVKPKDRPNCNSILNNPLVLKHTSDNNNGQDQSSTSKSQLLQTIQMPRNEKQWPNHLPKSKYDNETAKSVERLNENSTENSTSPFRSPQTRVEPRISQSQVAPRMQNDFLKNNSSIDRKHQLLIHQPREIAPSQKQERPQSTRPSINSYQKQNENRKISPAPVPAPVILSQSQAQQQQYQQPQSQYLQQQSQQSQQNQQQQQKQKSTSPINRDRKPYQPQISNPTQAQNPRYNNNPVRPYVSQSTNQLNVRQPPPSANKQQQLYSQPVAMPKYGQNYQQPTPKDKKYVHPQSATPTSIDITKSDRPQVFPIQARVANKPKTQPTENQNQIYSNNKRVEYVVQRPAGKPTRPLSSNLYNERIVKADYQPQYNLITGNYNHYYPIENYSRHASDQNLIRYQMRQADIARQARPQRKY